MNKNTGGWRCRVIIPYVMQFNVSLYGKAKRHYNTACIIVAYIFADVHAEEAKLSRLSYNAYVRAEEARLKAASKLTVKQVAKMAVIFCFIVSTM